MSCREAMAAVVRVIEEGGTIADEQREHIRSCARCRELLDSAERFQSEVELETPHEPAVDEKRLTSEIRALRVRDVLTRAGITAAIAFTVLAILGFFASRADPVSAREMAIVLAAGTVVATIPVLVFYTLLAALRDRHGNRICKRLRPGRQVSGVCLGLSEATGIPVGVLRLLFVVFLFVKGIGFWLYLALDLAMPVHPDDRQHLLRFKLRRMWQRRFAHADHDAR